MPTSIPTRLHVPGFLVSFTSRCGGPALPRAPHGRVRWGSIFKYKGLDAEAVILTDIGDDGLAFAQKEGLSWFDILYVGLTRARYRCIVVPN